MEKGMEIASKRAAKLSGTAQTSNSSSINFATRYVFRRLLERDGVVLRRRVGKIECTKKGENAKGLMVVCQASGARDVHQPFCLLQALFLPAPYL
jgi:hypothetical protein